MNETESKNIPNDEEYRYHKTDYRERHRFWADQTLTQFGNANNFFIIIGFAIFGYIVNELDQFSKLELSFECKEINSKATLLMVSLILSLFSLISGTLTLLSRLYDLRYTRHINTIRIKVYSKEYDYDKDLPDKYIDIKKDLKFPQFQITLFKKFLDTILSDKHFLSDDDLKFKTSRDNNFIDLRTRAIMLGRFSWISFKWQIIWISLAVLIFIIFWK